MTLLTPRQLTRMHETEGGYHFCRLPCTLALDAAPGGGPAPPPLASVYVYHAAHRHLALPAAAAAPVALAEVPATGRVFAALTQAQVQRAVQRTLVAHVRGEGEGDGGGPEASLEACVPAGVITAVDANPSRVPPGGRFIASNLQDAELRRRRYNGHGADVGGAMGRWAKPSSLRRRFLAMAAAAINGNALVEVVERLGHLR